MDREHPNYGDDLANVCEMCECIEYACTCEPEVLCHTCVYLGKQIKSEPEPMWCAMWCMNVGDHIRSGAVSCSEWVER